MARPLSGCPISSKNVNFFSVLNWFMYFYTKYIDTEIKCVFHSLAYVYSRGLLPLMVPKYLINFEILLLNFILQ